MMFSYWLRNSNTFEGEKEEKGEGGGFEKKYESDGKAKNVCNKFIYQGNQIL